MVPDPVGTGTALVVVAADTAASAGADPFEDGAIFYAAADTATGAGAVAGGAA